MFPTTIGGILIQLMTSTFCGDGTLFWHVFLPCHVSLRWGSFGWWLQVFLGAVCMASLIGKRPGMLLMTYPGHQEWLGNLTSMEV